jgi:hypothetical protein
MWLRYYREKCAEGHVSSGQDKISIIIIIITTNTTTMRLTRRKYPLE